MNCNECVKINPLPQCVDVGNYSFYFLTGMIFTSTNTEMVAKFKDTATGKTTYIDFDTDMVGVAEIEIYDLFPLMDHIYEIAFVNKVTGDPELFTVVNAPIPAETGCCLEFGVNIGQTDNNEYFEISTTVCS